VITFFFVNGLPHEAQRLKGYPHLYPSAMMQPDGMGADRHRERQNMKAARQETRTPTWELAAMDSEGNELYRTEYQETKEQAVDAAAELNSSDPDTPEMPEGVARFKPVKTED